MDSSDSEEEKRRGRRDQETIITSFNDLLYSPCHICQLFLKTILNCLGYDDFPGFRPTNPPSQDTGSEVEMKSNEDEGVGELSSRTAMSAARSRPTRPHISSGRGGQVN